MNIEKITGYSFILLMVAILGIAPSGYAAMKSDTTSAAEIRKETEELLKTLKAYTIEQRDEAIRKTAEVLEKLDKRIDAQEKRLDDNWAKMDQAARESARASLKELHRIIF